MKRKSKFWLDGMAIYVRFRMRRAFRDVLGRGIPEARSALAQGPAILIMNHVAWWDPLLLILLEKALGADGYGLMAADSLRELPFFGRLGALPLHRGDARRALSDLESAATLLDRPLRFVAIFPSGEQRPSHFPLSFKSGASRLQERSGAKVIALALRYEFLESPKPTLLFSLGSAFEIPEGSRPKRVSSYFEERVREELGRIDEEVATMLTTPSELPGGLRSLLHRKPQPLRAGRVPLLLRLAGALRGSSYRPRSGAS